MTRWLARAAWAILAVVALGALTAPHWAESDPVTQLDPAATSLLPPNSHRIAVELTDGRRRVGESIERSGERWTLVRKGRAESFSIEEVARIEPLTFRWGTDRLGRDVLARTLYGARTSLAIAAIAVLLATAIGVAVGAVAGSTGGWVDEILMRFSDGVLGFPRLVLLLAIASFSRPGLATLVVVLALTSWMPTARLVRGEVRTLRRRDFVQAARAAGSTPWSIFRRHLLPHLRPTLAVDVSLRVGELILLEASLSYLGLGVPAPSASWGSMIGDGQADLVRAWWISFFPGLALVATVVALTILSDLASRSDASHAR